MASQVKNLPGNTGDTEMRVLSLGGGDPLEEEMAPHSSILARKFPWREMPGGVQPTGLQTVGLDRSDSTSTRFILDVIYFI